MSRNYFSTLPKHGKVTGDTYHKEVTGSIHMLRSPRAWAIDARDLVEAERLGAVRIEIFDLETQITYASTVENFRAKAVRIDRGYGPQLALEIRHWCTTAPLRTGSVSAVKSGKVERPQARQFSLPEGVKL